MHKVYKYFFSDRHFQLMRTSADLIKILIQYSCTVLEMLNFVNLSQGNSN